MIGSEMGDGGPDSEDWGGGWALSPAGVSALLLCHCFEE